MTLKIWRYLAPCVVAIACLATTASASELEELFLDAGGGITAVISVNTGNVITCSGSCGGLVITSTGDYKTLMVTGTLGQFTINTTGTGGLSTIAPVLQGLNQIEAATTGAGHLTVSFTNNDYCLGGGGCFGSQFVLSASTVNDTAIAGSTSDFAAYLDPANNIPAGTLIGSFIGLTGLSDVAGGVFANPDGSSGSLTSSTVLNFTGAGAIQANFQISTRGVTTVPEPASFMLMGSALTGLIGLRKKLRMRN